MQKTGDVRAVIGVVLRGYGDAEASVRKERYSRK